MDGIRGEVSNKIRSAIKAKLMELGAYVDDELPDYIMVMVANKRSRQQMEDDLQLFLGDSTITFTAWLHTVLSKLQQVTVNSTELKKNADKKRPLSDDHKKDKKKKLKKEKEKTEKSPERASIVEKSTGTRGAESSCTAPLIHNKQIKSEPIDPIPVQDSSLNQSQSHPLSQSTTMSASTKSQASRIPDQKIHEEDEDDDFINLKADVEADMWGEAEESSASAVKNSNIEIRPSSENISDPRPSESRLPEIQQQLKETGSTSSKATIINTPAINNSISANASPSKKTPSENKPASRIIRISETIRQEQESLKQSSKPRDPQQEEQRSPPSPIIFASNSSEKVEDDSEAFGRYIVHELRQLPQSQRNLATLKIKQALAKRVFQSHIISQRSANDKAEKSQGRRSSSRPSDSHARRNEPRSNRNHEDLRHTLRKERQRERDHGRDREREQRRSRQQIAPRKSQGAVASIVHAPLSHDNTDGRDPSVQSIVRVKPRPKIPEALQANRSLILKAVAEAQKSVSKVVIRAETANLKSRVSPKKGNIQRRLGKDLTLIHKELSRVKIQSAAKKEQSKLIQSSRLPSRETLKKMSFTVLGKKAVPCKDTDLVEDSDEDSIILDPSLNILIQVPASPAEGTAEPPDPAETEKVQRWMEDVEEATKSDNMLPNVDAESTDAGADVETFSEIETDTKHVSDDEEFDDALEADISSLKTSGAPMSDGTKTHKTGTQFVVTLDGLDPRLLQSFGLEDTSPKLQSNNSYEEHVQDQQESIRKELAKEQLLRLELLRQQAAVREQKSLGRPTIAVPPVPAPLNPQVKRPASPSGCLETRPPKVVTGQNRNLNVERCKFWPTCKNGDKCEFHHPSLPCKLFPNCKFADRCLYIHPNCRFNSACTRVDCPFTHAGPRPVHTTPSSGPNHLGSQTIKQACKFFPNCSNVSCPFIHPMVCKFGTNCTKPNCQFIHSDKTLVSKHKWVRH